VDLRLASRANIQMSTSIALEAQRSYGNRVFCEALRRTPSSRQSNLQPDTRHVDAHSVVQRAVWTFNASTRTRHALGQGSGLWHDEADPDKTRTSEQLGLDGRTLAHGDKYDEATRQLHGSGNVSFSQRGVIPDTPQAHAAGRAFTERTAKVRGALVDAKQRVATALSLLQAAHGGPTGELLKALKGSFPGFQTASPEEIATLIPHIAEVLQRIGKGLNSEGAQIALVGRPSMFDRTAIAATSGGAAGWVDPSTRDLVGRLSPDYMKGEALPTMDAGRSGPINLTEAGENPWFIIHEATHRYAGTLDYQYSPHSLEVTEDTASEALAGAMHWTPEERASEAAERLGKRVARDPRSYTGKDESSMPKKQQNWYAMGKRALMNADSYAQFVLTATGHPIPQHH
jgi:hypothetical protein